MNKPTPAEFRPNYDIGCLNCEQIPTVDVYVRGKLERHTEMCGPCTWGEADTLDPENW